MAITRSQYSQSAQIAEWNIDSQGACWELCRRWVAQHLAGQWQPNSSVFDITVDKGSFQKLADQARQNENLRDGRHGVEGGQHHVDARRTAGCCTYSGLRSRNDVINHVLSVPGIYIYLAGGAPNNGQRPVGHAMAFAMIGEPRAFFDPSQGEWRFENESDAGIRTWWSGFWEGRLTGGKKDGADYKTALHKGSRTLVRYNTIANS